MAAIDQYIMCSSYNSVDLNTAISVEHTTMSYHASFILAPMALWIFYRKTVHPYPKKAVHYAIPCTCNVELRLCLTVTILGGHVSPKRAGLMRHTACFPSAELMPCSTTYNNTTVAT
jgi:heme A synthase